jgi:hypothetical protein
MKHTCFECAFAKPYPEPWAKKPVPTKLAHKKRSRIARLLNPAIDMKSAITFDFAAGLYESQTHRHLNCVMCFASPDPVGGRLAEITCHLFRPRPQGMEPRA